MNFFERQRRVRRMSWRLVLLFAVAVVGIVATIDLVVALLFGRGRPPTDLLGPILVTSVLVATLIGLASLFRTLSLRGGGGGKVARSLGAVPVPEDTRDPDLRRLRNVVEEVAIASGVPVPELYVLENEPGINAFAAGWSPSDAAVAVTRGTLTQLNRDELQGVIAHEFSHVVNGDMRLNIRLIGVLFGILVLTIVGRVLVHVRGGKNNPVPLIGLALVVAGFAGVFVARIIKAAVSRQREYLADASAVQFTRQTAGLTGALKKIAGVPAGSTLGNPRAEDVSHMLFGAGKGLAGLFATHPPLLKRIQALEPRVTAEELERLRQRWATAPPSGRAEDAALGLAPAAERAPADRAAAERPAAVGGAGRAGRAAGALPPADARVPASPDAVTAAVGAPAETAYQRAGTILDQLPDEVLDRARDPRTVLPLVFGLLLSAQQEVEVNQHAALVARYGQALADAARREGQTLATLHPMLRLPLAEVAFPALRHRPGPEQDAVMEAVQALIQADGRLSASEYCLSRLLHAELYEAAHRRPPWGKRRYPLSASRSAAALLLATLAAVGHREPAAAEQAFHAGAAGLFPRQRLPYAPPAQGVSALDAAWAPLDGLNPADKALLVRAMVAVVGHDGQVTVAELELLRTICALLHCPLPPLAEPPSRPAGAEAPVGGGAAGTAGSRPA
jgi:Zn-dependent protease with chaperone function